MLAFLPVPLVNSQIALLLRVRLYLIMYIIAIFVVETEATSHSQAKPTQKIINTTSAISGG